MTLAVYALACLLLGMALLRLRVVQHAGREFRHLAGAIAVLRAPDIPDDEKEMRARRAALDSGRGVLRLVLRLSGVGAATALPVLLADRTGLAAAADVWRLALRPDVMLATTALVAGCFLAGRAMTAQRV